MSDRSVIEWHGFQLGHKCGYCKSAKSNFSHGMTAHTLTTEDYQALIDRGWRRSGTYVYKPSLNTTCCPMYPIRCSALELELTKSQKQCIKRVNKFLNYGIRPSEETLREHEGQDYSASNLNVMRTSTGGVKGLGESSQNKMGETSKPIQETHQPKPGVGADPNRPRCVKAKLKRLEKKQESKADLAERSAEDVPLEGKQSVPLLPGDGLRETDKSKTSVNGKKAKSKTLEQRLNDIIPSPAHKLEVKLVEADDDDFMSSATKSYQVYVKYQMAIHGDLESKLSRRQYTGFLVDTPLVKPTRNPAGHKAGSYHQQYWLDGKLIAVGVIDILPHCISSVYLYYDPEFAFLSLGTYSALRELALTRELYKTQPGITFYYLGFYIHSCPKMRYKGQYKPSCLCCPETYTWHPIEDCVVKLDLNKYSRFELPAVLDTDGSPDINQVLCVYRRKEVTYKDYLKLNKKNSSSSASDLSEVTTYASLIGEPCAKRMLLFRQ